MTRPASRLRRVWRILRLRAYFDAMDREEWDAADLERARADGCPF